MGYYELKAYRILEDDFTVPLYTFIGRLKVKLMKVRCEVVCVMDPMFIEIRECE